MTQQKTTGPATRQVTTRGFAILPHQVADTVPQEIKGAVRSVYPALHRHGWGSDEGSWASIKTLMDESGFGRDGVRAALRWLTAEGWVTREERPGYTPRYRVRIEDPQPPKRTHPYEKQEGGATENSRGPLLKSVGEQEPSNKNPRTRKEPPTHYVGFPPEGETHGQDAELVAFRAALEGRASGGTVVADPHPQRSDPAPSPAKKPRMAKQKPPAFDPTPDDVPAALLPLQDTLLAFWAEKEGSNSERAWKELLGDLQRIWAHPNGGTEVVRAQLSNGIQNRWRSITFANWLKYGQAAPARAGGGPRKSATDQAADNVLAMFAARGIA